MTVAVAWIRKLRDCEELVFVSDSRLSGDGCTFDACPKILTLPRSDCAICFAGYTGHAFPMMLQLSLAIDSYAPSRRGSLDLTSLKSHALKVFDGMAELIRTSQLVSAKQNESPGAEFLFGGYSWVKKQFELWSISFNTAEGRFVAQPAHYISHCNDTKQVELRRRPDIEGTEPIGRIAFAGDQSKLAKDLLKKRLGTQNGAVARAIKLDMEPFEVVRDMLRDSHHSETIGGAPQVTKVYQYMRTAPLGLYWPSKKSGSIHLQGRACLGYEQIDRWVLDPDTLVSERPLYSRNDADDSTPEAANGDT
ncbi:hypothetical protein GALL_310920 [mine drainage metagenome]|uniref:Uncharacterized protein n=1 Tax=mine drainage metagenome TaxID=410659 RepID=A0A1J5RBM9_9ZZZZ